MGFRESAEDAGVWGRGLPVLTPQIHPSKNIIFHFQVVHLSFGVLKIVFSGVVLAQLSKKPRAIKNGLLIVWLKGSAVNLRGGLQRQGR